MYSSMKEDTVWSFERLQSYVDENYAKEKELPENWVYTTFTVSFCIRALLLVIFFGWMERGSSFIPNSEDLLNGEYFLSSVCAQLQSIL